MEQLPRYFREIQCVGAYTSGQAHLVERGSRNFPSER